MNKVLVLCLTSLLPICGDVSATRTPAAFTQQSSVLHRTVIERNESRNDRSQAEMRNQNQTQEQPFMDKVISYTNETINFVRDGVNWAMNTASKALRWLRHTVKEKIETFHAYVEDYQANNSTGFFGEIGHRVNAGWHRVSSLGHGFVANLNRPF